MVAAFQALGVAHGLERPGNHLAYGGIIGRHHFLFDRLQLQSVIAACRASTALPDTGCKLFDQVRQQKKRGQRCRPAAQISAQNWFELGAA
ncbi:hypothetical protein [Comamonas testosteroni]|uniref:hypothetical protein n=1 Tax=Comamonas testosteroni TaxID=285 RepID=UPI001EE8AB4C|nr:hypothetical protein [Comamonas testosteroni]